MRTICGVRVKASVILAGKRDSCRHGPFKNTLIPFVVPPKILHEHCFQFLLGLTIASREIENRAYAKLLETAKSILVFLEKAYSSTSFSENVVVAETSHQMLKVL